MDQSEDHIEPNQHTQSTTITIHMLMRPMTNEDKTTNQWTEKREEMVDLEEKEKEEIERDEHTESIEPVERREMKGGNNECRCRSIGIQTTMSLERFEEGGTKPSEPEESNIHSLPPEILIKLVNYLPDIKTRFRLRRVCSGFRNLIDAPVIWKSRNELKIVVTEGGRWFCINGCRISGSYKQWSAIFHSYKRLKQNVCQAIRDLVSRINITTLELLNIEWLTDKDMLLTLAHEMLKYEHNTLERRLKKLQLCHHRRARLRLTEPLLFSIFSPLASSVETLCFCNNSYKSNINRATTQAFYRFVKSCSRLQCISFCPYNVECLETIRGKPIKVLYFTGSDAVTEQQLIDICNSFPQTLTILGIEGMAVEVANLENAKLLRSVQLGFCSEELIAGANYYLRRLGGLSNIRDIYIGFNGTISTQSVVTLVMTLTNELQRQQDRDKVKEERRVSLRLRSNDLGVLWPSESVRMALEQQGMDVQTTKTNVTGFYATWRGLDEQFVIWMELRKGTVCISLHCNCNSQ